MQSQTYQAYKDLSNPLGVEPKVVESINSSLLGRFFPMHS